MEMAIDINMTDEMKEYMGKPVIIARRYHDFSCGHRVHGHEGKCALLHGHNYRVTFSLRVSALDAVGRVLDFSVIKSKLCAWLEEQWDHRFIAWEQDSYMRDVCEVFERGAFTDSEAHFMMRESIVWVPFNPTAENMALHLLQVVGPQQLIDTPAELIHVCVEETRKCRAEAFK